MTPRAVIFSGMGSLAECADLDREAWNAAFRVHGLAWEWSWDTYCELLRPGGDRHLAARFAEFMRQSVDAQALDETHQRLFAARLADGIPLRPGVAPVLKWAAQSGAALALVSRSEAEPVRALLKATARARAGIPFDLAILREDVDKMAPEPDAMQAALAELAMRPDAAVAIVDTRVAGLAATRAGIPCLAFPGCLAEADPFDDTLPLVRVLSVAAVQEAWCGPGQAAAE